MKLKRASIFTKIVLVALVVYAVVMLVDTRARVAEAEADRAALQAQVEAVRQENAELKYDIDHAGDPEVLAEIARNKLGLVKPGEKIYYDVRN